MLIGELSFLFSVSIVQSEYHVFNDSNYYKLLMIYLNLLLLSKLLTCPV